MILKGCHLIFSPDTDGVVYDVREVWHTPSGGKKDDHVSVGFVKFPVDKSKSPLDRTHEIEFARKYGVCYQLSVVSTSLMEKIHKNWKLEIELPDAKLPS